MLRGRLDQVITMYDQSLPCQENNSQLLPILGQWNKEKVCEPFIVMTCDELKE